MRATKASSFAVRARPSMTASRMRARAGSPTTEAIQARSISGVMASSLAQAPRLRTRHRFGRERSVRPGLLARLRRSSAHPNSGASHGYHLRTTRNGSLHFPEAQPPRPPRSMVRGLLGTEPPAANLEPPHRRRAQGHRPFARRRRAGVRTLALGRPDAGPADMPHPAALSRDRALDDVTSAGAAAPLIRRPVTSIAFSQRQPTM